jgi:hypothetical protein
MPSTRCPGRRQQGVFAATFCPLGRDAPRSHDAFVVDGVGWARCVRTIQEHKAPSLRSSYRGSWARRLGQDRLRHLPSCRAANADRAAEGRTEPSRKGSRPQRAVPVPWVREEGPSGRFDQVAAAHLLTAGPTLPSGVPVSSITLFDDQRPILGRNKPKFAAAVSVAGASRSFREPSHAADAHHPPRAPSRCCCRIRRAACRTSRSSPAGCRTKCASRRRSAPGLRAPPNPFARIVPRIWLIAADEESNIRPQMGNRPRTAIPRSSPSPKTRRKTIVALDPGPPRPRANRLRCRWLECPFGGLIWRSRNAAGVRLARLVSAHGGGRQRCSPATGASDERHSSKMHLKPR